MFVDTDLLLNASIAKAQRRAGRLVNWTHELPMLDVLSEILRLEQAADSFGAVCGRDLISLAPYEGRIAGFDLLCAEFAARHPVTIRWPGEYITLALSAGGAGLHTISADSNKAIAALDTIAATWDIVVAKLRQRSDRVHLG